MTIPYRKFFFSMMQTRTNEKTEEHKNIFKTRTMSSPEQSTVDKRNFGEKSCSYPITSPTNLMSGQTPSGESAAWSLWIQPQVKYENMDSSIKTTSVHVHLTFAGVEANRK